MKVKDLNRKVVKIKQKDILIKENKDTLRDVLSLMFNVIQRFETDGNDNKKNDIDKIDVLKNMISDMMKDEE